ncbi:3778_t:CDS:2 [Paraglomus brasilianum]|uniref:Signal recognition particle 9 kDa protein n=2 Tax=Paraglomus TaxID=144537 RepID=A0A9N9DL08_9GLOM|nr:3778_t:CDS:2 [Paraglomus brasilianum]
MVYISTWPEFQKAVEDLYLNAPGQTRYVVDYSHKTGFLVLKVTDDRTCLKYKTESAPDMKKFERLNSILMTKMQNRKESVGSEEGNPTSSETPTAPPVHQPKPSTKSGSSSKKKKGKKNR